MVSSVLEMDVVDLVQRLREIRARWKNDNGYRTLREEFPKTWPM